MRLELNNITVKIGKRNILEDVSLSFSGPLNYLVGLNGSGKTTLLQAILGLVPVQGRVLLDGQDLLAMPAKERAQRVGIVFQKFSVPFQTVVSDFVLMGRYAHTGFWGGYSADDRARVQDALQNFGIAHLADRDIHSLSGGEWQRAVIARSLVQDPQVLLLDEPAQQLDPLNEEIVYQMLETMAANGRMVICSTHGRMPLANPKARVIGLQAGKIVYDEEGGRPWEELKNQVYRRKAEVTSR